MAKRKRLTTPDAKEAAALRKENEELRAELERLHESNERQRKAKFTIPKGRQTSPKGTFRRLVIPDTHGSSIDKEAARSMLSDASQMDVREVVLLGDHVDCGGFLSQHHLTNYLAETSYSYEDDIAAANVFLDEVQAACPKAKIYYIQGNHERRVERYAVDKACGSVKDSGLLLRALGPEYVLHLKDRNIEYVHTLDTKYNQGRTRNTLELGKCLFMHGYSHAKNATEKTLNDLGKSVVVGHIHRRQSVTRTTHDSEISAWCDGCLCDLTADYYRHGRPSHHSHGYGVQTVTKNGDFFHQSIPIIGGRSFLFA